MSCPLDTDEWALGAFLKWKPKVGHQRLTCPTCNGEGQVGGHFKDPDGPRDCPECFGSRTVREPGPKTSEPVIPPDLVAHMRAAWLSYFNPKQGT